MEEEKTAREQGGKHRQRENTVAPAAAPLQISGRAREIGEDVEIGKVRPNDEGGCTECGSLA